MFIHHPEGYIVIDELNLPLDFFKSLESEYRLHSDWKGRRYVPNVNHALIGDNGEVSLGTNWTEGDYYISRKNDYAAAYAVHLENLTRPTDIVVGINDNVESVT